MDGYLNFDGSGEGEGEGVIEKEAGFSEYRRTFKDEGRRMTGSFNYYVESVLCTLNRRTYLILLRRECIAIAKKTSTLGTKPFH